MSNNLSQTAKEREFEERERQIRRRELDLDFEKHQLKIKCDTAGLERRELKIEQDKVKLKSHESKFKEKMKMLDEIETDFEKNGADIIRLAISKQFRRGVPSTKENELKLNGDTNALQRCRYERYVYEQELDVKEDRLAAFLDTETRLREIAQRELCLKEQLEQDPTVKQELIDAQREYGRIEHEWLVIRNSFSSTSLQRAFELWRGTPRWYMHRVLREDCAERGGCCGRGCECCLSRKLDLTRKRAAGHCTVECGCCQKARGYDLSEEEKTNFSIRYAVSQDSKKDIELKEFQVKKLELRNLELQNIQLQQMWGKNSMKDNVVRYEFSEGGFAEYERYINGADISDNEAEFTDDEITDEITDEIPEEEDPYYRRISLASIWGLVDGNFEDPVDLIDEKPYHPTWKNDACDEQSFALVSQEENNSMMTETDW
ncbi:hypothetical protein N7447_003033 [Penicillium robsamsonii]|uniref:uncharacterized protein n=1 Tax=Penicillium robsamsonii TaxID=1792511 RepID=UPI002547D56B|nr:uncharacterized protein N7447_003033 [Penicillium robsamsonii]KAJ5837007.1 hypothetical protein N7447_003033 [Penicillium robsamsonii]